jgi:hypothetical protein
MAAAIRDSASNHSRGQVLDAIMGAPAKKALDKWIAGTTVPSVCDRSKRSTDERIESLLWHPPKRLGEADALRLIDRLESQLGSRGWEGTAKKVLATAVPVLVGPIEVAAKLDGERPPEELDAELRLPFDALAVVFGARFELADEHLARLPEACGAVPSYAPWLAHLHARGGAVRGVVLFAKKSGAGLADSVLWLVEADGEQIPIPGLRSRSALNAAVENFAAAICWGGWLSGWSAPPPQRRVGADRSAAHTGPTKPPPDAAAHVVKIRSRRNEKWVSGSSGSGRVAHFRRGHWKRVRRGPRDDWYYEWQWRNATYVNGRAPTDSARTVYRLPELG